jgi:hypothetical protein
MTINCINKITNEKENKQERLIKIVTKIRKQYQPVDLWFT